MGEIKLTNADMYGRDGARTFGLNPDAEYTQKMPTTIQVGWPDEGACLYEIYNDKGNFVGRNHLECHAFAAELQRRYNVHTEMLEALNTALAAIVNPQAFNIEQVILNVRAAIQKAEGN